MQNKQGQGAEMTNELRTSPVHEWLALRARTARGRIARGLYRRVRRALLRLYDPPVGYALGDARITLPASHPLPFYQLSYPHYDRALGRLVACLQSARGGDELVAVDIGANVGDTAAALLEHPNVFVVAVDGNPAFTGYLRANLRAHSRRSYVAECFVGPPDLSGMLIKTEHGTARLVESSGDAKTQLVSLQAILDAAGKSRADLIKIDTDGFDIEIIRDSIALLTAMDAVLFFEFDPVLFAPNSKDGWSVFEQLAGAGYRAGIAYRNTGDFIRSLHLNDARAVEELRAYLASRSGPAYLDFAFFKDDAVFERFLAEELAHFSDGRQPPLAQNG